MTEYAHNWDYQAPAVVEVQPVQPAEPSVEEHAQMIQKAFGKVLDKAMAYTDLNKRVEDLANQVRQLQEDVRQLTQDLYTERQAHEETRGQLVNVQSTLSQRESTIHDLVQERDIVLGERNQAQEQRDSARRECNDWETKYNEAQRIIDSLTHDLTEAKAINEELKAKMEAFRNAFRGLAA